MRTLSRREFLRISILTTAGTVAAACAQPTAEPEPVEAPTTEPPAPAAPTTAPAEALPARTEIPMLAELVEKGELPPMEERLPANPLVIDVYEGIGTYGGNWRRAYKGLSDRWGPDKLQEQYAIEFRMEPGGELYRVAHFYESYEVSDDGTEYTWHMREGVKWSDGEEIDTEDVQFWYDYRFMDETLTPVKSSLLTVGGEPMRLTVVDRYTFKTTFAAPHPLLISQLFSPNGLSIGPTFCMPSTICASSTPP